jgi:hypothetical protein
VAIALTIHLFLHVALPADDVLQNRTAAANAYSIYIKDRKAGLQAFREEACKDYPWNNNNASKFILKWGQRMRQTGSVLDNNAGRIGRPSKVDPQDVELCVKEFLAGYWVEKDDGDEVWIGFTSIENAAESGKAPLISNVMLKNDIEPRSLWRRMLKVCPIVANCKHPVDVKPKLTEKLKKERAEESRKLLGLGTKALERVVFVDAKKLYVGQSSCNVYTVNPHYVMEDDRIPLGKTTSPEVLNYYAGVNAKLGTVDFHYVTGTTGINKEYTIKVCMFIVTTVNGLPANLPLTDNKY